jgi:hypothetical protein
VDELASIIPVRDTVQTDLLTELQDGFTTASATDGT